MNKFLWILPVFCLFWGIKGQAKMNPLLSSDWRVIEQNQITAMNPLAAQETNQLEDMLSQAGLNSASLSFEKDWDLSTREKSAWHLNALQNPWQGLKQMGELRYYCSLQVNPAKLLNHFSTIAWDIPEAYEIYQSAFAEYSQLWDAQVHNPKQIFAFYESMLDELSPQIGEAYSNLDNAGLDSLSAFFFSSFTEAEDKDKYQSFFTQHKLPDPDENGITQVAELLQRINYPALQASTLRYYALSQVIAEGAKKLKFTNKKMLLKRSEYGLMIIGTKANDCYIEKRIKSLRNSQVCLLIDPAGDDLYELDIITGKDNPCYLLIDYQGNDIYRNAHPAGMFFSLTGQGISYDMAGDDLYQTDDYAFAAFLGTNLHFDLQGSDNYRSGLFAQGAAMCGISLLCDYEGKDTYQATTMAQGLGSIRGVGALLEYAGADLYQLGGKYLHAPLMPNDFRSMGQGMGFGFRPDFAGGLGLLYDKAGNDQYLGGVYAQGVGYWYATGMLIDEAGNDVYNAIYYPQGSGIHLASGFLYDGGGDDAYYSRNGPGQGAGHDWGLGVLIDAGGNDAYSIQGGNGLGLSNSVGIFVDKKGDDRYERQETQNYGSAALSRFTGGIGLFLDSGGKDCYPDSLMANNKTWHKGVYGFGRDIELEVKTEAQPETAITPDPLVEETAPIDEVFAAAAEWEVGSAVARVKAARKVLAQRPLEAQDYILNNKLNSKSGLEYRALEAFLADNPGFRIKLYDFVFDADSLKAKTALSLIAGTGDEALIVAVKAHLKNQRYVSSCLSILGSIKSLESVNILSEYAFHPSERYRYLTARSLRQIATPQAYSALSSMRYDESFLVQALIRNLPEVKP